MTRSITNVAVIGAGTMGAGIAGICAAAGLPVTLLDLTTDTAAKAVSRLTGGRNPVIDEASAGKIRCGSIDNDLNLVADADWICEAIVEDLAIKQALFTRLDAVRKSDSIVTSNTSGIPLRDICSGQSAAMNADIAVTHFFNPVHIMRLLELVPGENTSATVTESLADFFSNRLGKGVVYAKDTVNFIGNRIGCFWILAGLHKGIEAQRDELSMEMIDTLLSKPIGLPPTGLYGLVDLIGLDIMDHVSKNLRANLPANDPGFHYLDFPAAEQKMLAEGQLGRKSGGGYYRLEKHDDGTKTKYSFDLDNAQWRTSQSAALDASHSDYRTLALDDSREGQLVWELMSETLCYAANLVPDIADDIVNVDRAMRWGFNWAQGPFEMIDGIGSEAFADKLKQENRPLPRMLAKLIDSGNSVFYQNDEYFTVDGEYRKLPPE